MKKKKERKKTQQQQQKQTNNPGKRGRGTPSVFTRGCSARGPDGTLKFHILNFEKSRPFHILHFGKFMAIICPIYNHNKRE